MQVGHLKAALYNFIKFFLKLAFKNNVILFVALCSLTETPYK